MKQTVRKRAAKNMSSKQVWAANYEWFATLEGGSGVKTP
jgi:hypothetical protein